MRNILMTASVLALGATAAAAGGVERSAQSVAILFETGKYAEFSLGVVSPDVSGALGVPVGPFPVGSPSGDMLGTSVSLSFGYKQALNDKLDVAIILDQPIGAEISYPGTFGASPYPLAGTTADLNSTAVTGLVKYKFPSNVSVYGGLRMESVKGEVGIPFVSGYSLETNTDYELGYVVGVAWERPDIAARVALTYNSAITHTLESTETIGGGTFTGSFETEVPQSVNLEFQTGIAADTLLFGSIRWVDWSEFQIDPPIYPLSSPLVSYQSDRITYNLGIGRRFNENWSGAVTLGYEPSNDDITGNLGPTDGYKSIGLAATYTQDKMEITAGIRYFEIGDATTTLGAGFTDNHAIGAGVKIAYTF